MQGDSAQHTGALLHTKLPTIRTRQKQRPGKRKSAAAVTAGAATAPPTIADLPWMQEWIATGALTGSKRHPLHASATPCMRMCKCWGCRH